MRLYGRWRGAHRRCRPSASLMNNGASLGKWTWNRWENYFSKKEFSVSLLYNISAAFSFGFQPFLFFMFLFLYMCASIPFPPYSCLLQSSLFEKTLMWSSLNMEQCNILFFSPFPMLSPPAQQLWTVQLQREKEGKKRENKNISEPEWVIQGIIKVSDLIYQWPSRAGVSLPDPPTAAVS